MEGLDQHQQLILGAPADFDDDKDSDKDTDQTSKEPESKANTTMNSNQNAADIIMEDLDYEDSDDLDKLGTLELEELEGIVTFADNMATKLAI